MSLPADDHRWGRLMTSVRCVRCRLRRCVCAEIPLVETRTRFVILRHQSELSKSSNTAHFAALAIPGCEVVEYGRLQLPFDETRLATGEGTWLLFPGGTTDPPPVPPERLIVLDGSWSQARRMYQRIGALRGLRLWTLPAPAQLPARARLRRTVHEFGMSTLEAIARAVALLEGEARAAPLERLHDAIVRSSRS